MALKLDTFQKDIADEIKRQDKVLTDVNSIPTTPDNQATPPVKQKQSNVLTVLVIASTISICGILGLLYFYFHDSLLPPSASGVEVHPDNIPKVTENLSKISPVLAGEIGNYVTLVEKKERGYVLTISNYSPVFAYMTRNESSYSKDLLELFPVIATSTGASTTPLVNIKENKGTSSSTVATTTNIKASSTQLVASSTSLGTTTLATSTASKAKKTTPPAKKKTTKTSTSTTPIVSTTTPTVLDESTTTPIIPLFITSTSTEETLFKDLTLDNQNMRVYMSGNHRVVYAFVGDTKLLISDSPEGILALRNAILH